MVSFTPAINYLINKHRSAKTILNNANVSPGVYDKIPRRGSKRKIQVANAKEYAKIVENTDPANIYMPDAHPFKRKRKR